MSSKILKRYIFNRTYIFSLLVEEHGEGKDSGPFIQAAREPLPRVVQTARHRSDDINLLVLMKYLSIMKYGATCVSVDDLQRHEKKL